MSPLSSAPANATRVAPPLEAARSYPAKPADVYLFGTCVIDVFFPGAGMDAIRLLEREGIRVHFPQAQSCCGQPAYTSGPAERCQVRLVPIRSYEITFEQPTESGLRRFEILE